MNSPEIKKAILLGQPVSHSLSPRLHQYWLKEYNVAGQYEALAVVPEELEKTLRSLAEQGFCGVNLTIPHKESALLFMDDIDKIAKRIGAVNTIVIKDKKLLGTNTDAYGFMQNLRAHGVKNDNGHALVLGAGGAARAICAGLTAEKWQVTLAARSEEKARTIADKISKSIHVIPWEKKENAMKQATLLVNTTPLGMKGQTPLNIELHDLPTTACVCDIVYNPLMTLLLSRAKKRGNHIVTGLGMLLYQAQPAFEAWFGVKPEVTNTLKQHMLEALS